MEGMSANECGSYSRCKWERLEKLFGFKWTTAFWKNVLTERKRPQCHAIADLTHDGSLERCAVFPVSLHRRVLRFFAGIKAMYKRERKKITNSLATSASPGPMVWNGARTDHDTAALVSEKFLGADVVGNTVGNEPLWETKYSSFELGPGGHFAWTNSTSSKQNVHCRKITSSNRVPNKWNFWFFVGHFWSNFATRKASTWHIKRTDLSLSEDCEYILKICQIPHRKIKILSNIDFFFNLILCAIPTHNQRIISSLKFDYLS